jgi:hypothetical protein
MAFCFGLLRLRLILVLALLRLWLRLRLLLLRLLVSLPPGLHSRDFLQIKRTFDSFDSFDYC